MIRPILVTCALVFGAGAALAATPADMFRSGNVAGAVAAYRGQIDAAVTPQEKSVLHKELGDLFAAKDNYPDAAAQYVAALALSRAFPVSERLQMATAISWADRLDDAVSELNAILVDEPANVAARVHLARVLSWQGKQDQAISEADKILSAQPENRDALLVKANAFRWKGDGREAIVIYKGLLAKADDFDTRIGLAHALLDGGDKKGAVENSRLLKPSYPYQERELKGLLDAIDRTVNHTIDARYGYYSDTDDNQQNRYGVSYTYQEPGWSASAQYAHANSRDLSRHNSANSFAAGGYYRLLPWLGVGGGGGIHLVDDSATNTILTWRLNADAEVGRGSVGVGVRKEALTDTAELVEKRIRVLTTNVFASQRLTDRIFLYGSYSYRDYSDSNHAHDVVIAPSYTLLAGNPLLRTGYRFRYLDFERQSRGGYFDPNNFMSHQIFVTLDWKKDRFAVYLEPYGGFQSFDRNNAHTDDLFGGITGTVSYRLTNHFSAEVNGEFGNYALGAGTTTGFEYFLVGTRLAYSF
ncbi:tetratricopeptide repeat protein [Geobacter pickeringii]|uniref:Uncharacterized protein n=1 Tax=Geobacter pickeringii TaxID=345632 RepID=A0A0B5BFZ6_9BACT|nr:tetratricopeptide repeat protein [Geobacter pickeringii]AJE03445.1 hypothetical protein GPICK_08840 [Geobacter pickeringii]